MLEPAAVNKNRGRASVLKSRLSAYVALCDDTGVQTIYGPYAPSKGRSRWRVQIRDSATGRKLSITASTKAEAEKLKGQLEQELAQASPLRVHEALDQYAEYKATAIRSQRAVADLIMALKLLVPDGPVMGVSERQRLEDYYLAETKRPGKSARAAATTNRDCEQPKPSGPGLSVVKWRSQTLGSRLRRSVRPTQARSSLARVTLACSINICLSQPKRVMRCPRATRSALSGTSTERSARSYCWRC